MNENIIEQVKSFEDAQNITGRPSVDFSMLPKDLQRYHEALYKMTVIAEALNEGWTPNWDDLDEKKHFPWFVMSTSGFAFHGTDCRWAFAISGYASRLCLKSAELAEYVGREFIDIWQDIQLMQSR